MEEAIKYRMKKLGYNPAKVLMVSNGKLSTCLNLSEWHQWGSKYFNFILIMYFIFKTLQIQIGAHVYFECPSIQNIS